MSAWDDSIYGRISIVWHREANRVEFSAQIPAGISGRLELPDGRKLEFYSKINTEWALK